MVFPVGWAVIILFRLLFSKQSPVQSDAGRNFRTLVMKLFLTPFWLALSLELGPMRVLAWLVLLVYLVPSILLDGVFVPLRLPRAAYYFSYVAWPLGFSDSESVVACYYAARALRRDTPGAWVAKLEAKLAKSKRSYGGALVALGVMALAKRDHQQARQLFRLAHALSSRFISRATRATARDYLVMEAARAGAYRTAIALGIGQKPRLRWSYFVARASRRLLRDPAAPSNSGLWFWWFVAPRRRKTYSLLRRALAVPREPVSTEPAPATDLSAALGALVNALRNAPRLDAARLNAVLSAVDTALDDATNRATIERRLLALNANESVDAVLARFRSQLTSLLEPVIAESAELVGGATMSPSLDEAFSEARTAVVRELAALASDYRRRTIKEDGFSPDIEWRLWANFCAVAERWLRIDPTAQAEVFSEAFVPICNFAVLQHNTHKQLALAHSMYAWLHRYAEPGSKDAALLAKNMKAAAT